MGCDFKNNEDGSFSIACSRGKNPLFQESGGSPESRTNEAEKLLEMLEGRDEAMAPNEQKFVTDLRERFEKYGAKTMVSPKQVFWLRDIKDRMI
jgi:phage shock protein A